jgi:hypothetical protein
MTNQGMKNWLGNVLVFFLVLSFGISSRGFADEASPTPSPTPAPSATSPLGDSCKDLGSDDGIGTCCNAVLKDQTQKSSQLGQQCKAFEYTRSAIILDSVLLGIDAGTLALCTTACAVGNPGLNIACEGVAIAAGAADMIAGVVQMAQSSGQMGTMDKIMAGAGIGMGGVGVVTGAGGMYKSVKTLRSP